MAIILNFRTAPARDESLQTDLDPRCSAEIVIFPGVRYEHWDDGDKASEARKATRGGRQRDTLVLED